jgi:hypothetical protein
VSAKTKREALRRLRGFAEGDKVYLLCCTAQRRIDELGMGEKLSAVVPSTFILEPVTITRVGEQVSVALGHDSVSGLETSHYPRFILTDEDVKLLPFPMRKG